MLAALLLLAQSGHAKPVAGAAIFALALLSKESVVPGLVALPLAVGAVAPSRREAFRRGLRALVLLGFIVAVWMAVRAWLFAGAEGALGSGGGWYRENERRLSSLEILGRALVSFVDLRPPQTDYSFLKQPASSAGPFAVIGLLGLLGIGFALWRFLFSSKREASTDQPLPASADSPTRHHRMAAALVWIVVFLLPYLQFFPIGALWAGRFAFLSLFGLGWLIAELVSGLPARPRTLATGGLALILLLGALQLHRRAPDWTDAVTLWSAEIRRQPDHAFAWSNLAVALQHTGDSTAGLSAACQATDLFPTYGESWLTRGRLERALGDHAAGRQSYYRAEELLGDHLDLQMEIARLDASEGEFEIALARLEAMAHKGAGNAEYEELIERVRRDLRRAKGE
jgi:hypothetical protein